MKKLTREDVIEQFNKVHGGNYGYSKFEYKGNNVKSIIICPDHGEFEQTPSNHKLGQGCPKCGRTRGDLNRKLSQDTIITQFKHPHGDKYDYSKFVYKGTHTLSTIICPDHGEFEQTPSNHKHGQGCPKCAGVCKLTQEDVITQYNQIHNSKYDYSLVKYINSKSKITIICPEHGEFEQIAGVHKQGKGCPKCKNTKLSITKTLSQDTVIKQFKQANGDKYDYSLVKYVRDNVKVTIICPKHGEFEQDPSSHKQGVGCPRCQHLISKAEQELHDYIVSILPTGTEVVQSDRSILGGKEIDVYIPSLKIGFEYNGLYWHSEKFRNNNDHIDKQALAREKGIELFYIWEDDWALKNDIIKSRISQMVGYSTQSIYARKCKVVEVETSMAKRFSDAHHLQGGAGSQYAYGLEYNGELVSVMTFTQDTRRKATGTMILLNRFCNKLGLNIVGGFSRLLKRFKQDHPEFNTIKTYADLALSSLNNNVYIKNGFTMLQTKIKPDYMYNINGKRENKGRYRKDTIVGKYGWGTWDETEFTIMARQDILKVYNAGTATYIMEY